MNSRKNCGLRIWTARYHGNAIAQNKRMPGSHRVFSTRRHSRVASAKSTITAAAKTRRDRSFRQHAQRHAEVEQREIYPFPILAPCPPCEHPDSEGCSERHVHRSGAGVADDSGARSRDERGVDFHAAAKFAEEKIDGYDEQRGIDRRGDARCHVAHAEDGVSQHCLPVVERGLLQPRTTAEHGSNPVVALQHLARDLRVARLIGADQAERSQAVEEEERAEAGDQQGVCAGASGHEEIGDC